MAAKYKDQVQFLLVYIREAHPTDGWQVQANERDAVLLQYARSLEHKEENASSCVRKLDIRFPTLIDNMENKVESEYSAWPDRLYLVGKDGRVLYKSAPGPGGFQPDGLEQAIQSLK